MNATVKKTEGTRVRLVAQIRRSIAERHLGGHNPLPSERVLAKKFGVGRNTLRLALGDLSREGVIRRAGPRVRTVVPQAREGSDVGKWLQRAVVLFAPPVVFNEDQSIQSNWSRYVMLGTVEGLRAKGLHAISLSMGDLHQSDPSQLANSKPMGVLVPDPMGDAEEVSKAIDAFVAAGVPVVVYGGSVSHAQVDRVASDHEAGSYELTRWMISQGRRRIAQFWPKPWETYWFEARQRGYYRAMREAGLEPLPVLQFPYVESPALSDEQFHYNVKQVMGFVLGSVGGAEGADGLLMGTDRDAFYAAAACRQLGINPDADVLIAGYDDYADRCEEKQWESLMPVATINKQNEKMGELMLELLLERAEGSCDSAPRSCVAAPRLIVRS